jgi:hypothetical protein
VDEPLQVIEHVNLRVPLLGAALLVRTGPLPRLFRGARADIALGDERLD